jgi:hypothetical protein
MNNQCLVNGDLLTINNCYNASIFSGLLNVQEFLQQVYPWNCLVNNKQATQTGSFCPLLFFGSHSDHCSIFWISFLSTSVCFKVILARTTFFHCLLPLHLIMHLHHALVGIRISMSCELGSTSKNPP